VDKEIRTGNNSPPNKLPILNEIDQQLEKPVNLLFLNEEKIYLKPTDRSFDEDVAVEGTSMPIQSYMTFIPEWRSKIINWPV
jgi:hypothetical protein